MKTTNLLKNALLLASMTICISACTMGDGSGETNQATSANEQTPAVNTTINSETVPCEIEGKISHDTYDASQAGKVTFERFPNSIIEFEATRNRLATEPHGAVALQVMAFELYRRNPDEGLKALKMNNTETNFTSTLRQLKEMMDTKDAVYARPYLAAALLQGATPENNYTPEKPYTVSVRVNPTSKYQESEFLNGTVIYLQVDSKGWDTNWRGVEVVKPEGEQFYLVSNCPALYTQCKKVKGTWQELK